MTDSYSLTLFDDWLHDQSTSAKETNLVHLVQSDDDFALFKEWLFDHKRPIAYDIEATGLDIFSHLFAWEIKTLQWGDTHKAFVFICGTPWFQWSIDLVLNKTDFRLLAHNATFDALGLDRHGYVDAVKLLKRTFDTAILSRLADPRSRKEGGVGHRLKDLAAHHVDPASPDSEKALKDVFKQQKWKEKDGWLLIPPTHPTLVHYGGMDVILTAKLFPKLRDEIKRKTMDHLVKYEHQLLVLCAMLQRKGMLLDVPYAERLIEQMTQEEESYVDIIRSYGVQNHNSTKMVADVLEELGARLIETTASGAFKVDKTVLQHIAEDESLGNASELATAVMNAKNAAKWRDAYVIASLEGMDANQRVHPSINTLNARTGRMSVSTPPLQQLPSGDDQIRRLFLAEPGCRMASIDFSGVELRVLAALSQDPVMLEVFKHNEDLHQTTADSTGVTRKVAKTVNFGKVYGAGPKTLARQSGMTEEEAQKVCDLFDATYKGVTEYSHKLAYPIKRGNRNFVITETGRKLPVDSERPYAALNYCIQSTARDVLGRAMIKVYEAGLWDHVLLPIHDELLFSFPEGDAVELAKEAGVVMETVLKGVHLPTEPDLGQVSWGSLYTEGEHEVVDVTDDDRMKYGDEKLTRYLSERDQFQF